MLKNDNRNMSPLRRRSRALHLREVAFALNLISAIAYALLVYVETHDLDYYLLRAAIRVDDILHFAQTNAVTTAVLRRQSQNFSTLFAGTELVILISMFGAMMAALLFLRLSPDASYRLIIGNLQFGTSQTLISKRGSASRYNDVSSDGKRILVSRLSQKDMQSVTWVTNFTDGLKK